MGSLPQAWLWVLGVAWTCSLARLNTQCIKIITALSQDMLDSTTSSPLQHLGKCISC